MNGTSMVVGGGHGLGSNDLPTSDGLLRGTSLRVIGFSALAIFAGLIFWAAISTSKKMRI